MTSTPPEQLAPRLSAARELLLGVPDVLPQIGSAELAELAALTAGVAAAARAAQAAVVLEADQRGVIAESDHPRLPEWVAQSCREADAPVTPSVGRALDRVARVCRGYGLARLREAITGRVPVEAAEQVAASYARLQGRIEVDCWDLILDGLIGWAAEGAVRRDLAQFEETMIGQYGTATEFKEREQLPQRRDFTAFTTGRDGMREARLFLDPDAEALLSAAITALSAPVPSPDGGPDLRTPGMRRADALLALARLATRPEKDTPGTGAKARIVVTIPLIDLLTGLVAVPGFTLPGLTAIPGLTGAGLSGAGLGGSLLNSDSSRLTGSTDADTGTGNSGHGVDPTGVARIGHTGAGHLSVAARQGLLVSAVHHAPRLLRRPPPHPLAPRWTHQPEQHGAAVPTPPHHRPPIRTRRGRHPRRRAMAPQRRHPHQQPTARSSVTAIGYHGSLRPDGHISNSR